MEFFPANGQGYIYDNSYAKQYGLERGLHMGVYDVNIGFETIISQIPVVYLEITYKYIIFVFIRLV